MGRGEKENNNKGEETMERNARKNKKRKRKRTRQKLEEKTWGEKSNSQYQKTT